LLACHGYLIDESWLIAASECFSSNATNDDLTASAWPPPSPPDDWTAEISYEHYGNDDYRSIESNRRGVKDVLVPPPPSSSWWPPPQTSGAITMTIDEGAPSGFARRAAGPTSSIVLAKLERPVRFR
jgi:hypothetical protein